MKNLNDFLNVAEFLGNEMTEDQASRLAEEAKIVLSIGEIETLLRNLFGGPLYGELSKYDAEMGGLSRY